VNTQVCQIITERILLLLQNGVCPWRRPWSQLSAGPRNFASGRGYHGINFMLLSALGFESPFFLTFRQVAERRGQVRKGSKGFPVVYWSRPKARADEEENPRRKVPFLRFYTVFHASQIDGIAFPAPAARSEFNPIARAEAVVAGWRDGPRIVTGHIGACYRIGADLVEMPSPERFDRPAEYYSTLFHELAHATGADHRLNRNLSRWQETEFYSREELVAEMASAFLCAHCGLDNEVIPNQAAYLANWIKILKGDPRLVIVTAGQAQKAANLILGIAPDKTEADAVGSAA
jgi:antirestriction protein ArdC